MLHQFIDKINAVEPTLSEQDTFIYVKGVDGVYEYINQACNEFLVQFTGIDTNCLKGTTAKELFQKHEINSIENFDAEVYRTLQPLHKVEVIKNDSSGQIRCLTEQSPIILDGKVHGLLAKTVLLNIFKLKNKLINLSFRENQVLPYWLFGFRAKEISKQCHCSQGTVETYVRRLKQKLSINSRSQLLQYISPAQTQAFQKLIS